MYGSAGELLLVFLLTVTIAAVMLTQIMLAKTHHRCYTKVARKSEQVLLDIDAEKFPSLYGQPVYRCFVIALATQVILYTSLAFARQAAGMPELGFFVLWMSFYIWGWQINMLDDYSFHTDFPTDFELISTKNRLKWHGRKIFVAMGALVTNFCTHATTIALKSHAWPGL